MASFTDIINAAMTGLGMTPPDNGDQLPAEPVKDSPYDIMANPMYDQELRAATPLSSEIPPGKNGAIYRYVNPGTGELTQEGQQRATSDADLALSFGPGAIRAYNGSPNLFDKFSMDKIGSGTGVQYFSRGLYFAPGEERAIKYRDALSPRIPEPHVAELYDKLSASRSELGKQEGDALDALWWAIENSGANSAEHNQAAANLKQITDQLRMTKMRMNALPTKSAGHLYEVDLNVHPDQLMDWENKLGKQPSNITSSLKDVGSVAHPSLTGSDVYQTLVNEARMRHGIDREAAEKMVVGQLDKSGIHGMRYLHTAGDVDKDIVMYNDSLINLLRRYGMVGTAGGGGGAGAAALGQQDNEQ